jgi:F420-0:gamma-glutamyl ligase
MERLIGTVSRGIRAPIIRSGDDIVKITVESVLKALESENIHIQDKDIISLTEAIVARAQGNYASVDDIASDIKALFGSDEIGLVFPIMSRNRFASCLKGFARGMKKLYLLMSFPADEVGNHLVDLDALDEKGINPWSDVLSEADFRRSFGFPGHRFTGIDYIAYYKSIVEAENCEVEIVLANDPRAILKYTKNVLACDVHTRKRTMRLLKNAGGEQVYGLEDCLKKPVGKSGYNEDFGLLGSNKATEESVKLFPRNCAKVVESIQEEIFQKTGKKVEVMVYGDGAFKDPIGGIWELADPVVSPAYTGGLEGQPHEIKLKYLADNDFASLSGVALKEAISKSIKEKNGIDLQDMASQGTTPRRLVDLVGSLSDLTSGSGDKGTPIVYIQGYFDNFTS